MKRITARALACGMALAMALPGSAGQDGCVACHGNPELFVKERLLHRYYQDWIKSPHAAAGLSCADCHGGDPTATEATAAHGEALRLINPASPLYYKNQPATCGTCHADKLEQFKTSKHYQALMADLVAPTCTTCHQAMNRRPYYREILVYGCKTCHNEHNIERLPLVAERAGAVFHRLNIAKGYLGWTGLFYAAQGWPGDSKERVDAIGTKYAAAVSNVHSFDLERMDLSSIEVLDDLKLMYEAARATGETAAQ